MLNQLMAHAFIQSLQKTSKLEQAMLNPGNQQKEMPSNKIGTKPRKLKPCIVNRLMACALNKSLQETRKFLKTGDVKPQNSVNSTCKN